MERIQKCAHAPVSDLGQIEKALGDMERIFRAEMPKGFNCWFGINGPHYSAGWECHANGFLNEIQAKSLSSMLSKWRSIDWIRIKLEERVLQLSPVSEGGGNLHATGHPDSPPAKGGTGLPDGLMQQRSPNAVPAASRVMRSKHPFAPSQQP